MTQLPPEPKKVGRPRRDLNSGVNPVRYNLALHPDDFNDVKKIAESEGTSFLHVARKFIRIGVHLWKAVKNDGAEIVVRTKGEEGKADEEKQILML